VGSEKYWKCAESKCRSTAITDGGILMGVQDAAGHSQVFQDIEAADERHIAQLTLGAVPKRERVKIMCVSTKLSSVWLNILPIVVFQQCNAS
jgi:hypothetical protein